MGSSGYDSPSWYPETILPLPRSSDELSSGYDSPSWYPDDILPLPRSSDELSSGYDSPSWYPDDILPFPRRSDEFSSEDTPVGESAVNKVVEADAPAEESPMLPPGWLQRRTAD